MEDTNSTSYADTLVSPLEGHQPPVVEFMQPIVSSNEVLPEKFQPGQDAAEYENEGFTNASNTDDNPVSSAGKHIPESSASLETNSHDEDDDNDEDDDDSDFGSFDDAEIEETLPPIASTTDEKNLIFNKRVMSDMNSFSAALELALEAWGGEMSHPRTTNKELLSGRALKIYSELSTIPHLKPSNWTRSKLRRDLLLRLGVPIDLDELEAGHPQSTDLPKEPAASEARNIDWEGLVIPSLSHLNINDAQRNEYMAETSVIMDKITTDNLSNLARQFLEEQISDEGLTAKLDQLNLNFKTLVSLASVWSKKLDELKNDHETFEAVVQSTTGYKQKLKREELRGQLKRRGTKRNSRLW